MTLAETLRAAADLVDADHGPGCPDREFWTTHAGWLRCVAIDEEYGEPETATRVRERTTALRLAEVYLKAPVASCTAGTASEVAR